MATNEAHAAVSALTPGQWAQFDTDGYLRLGRVCSPAMLTALSARMDQIMLTGGAEYPKLYMQICPSASGSWAAGRNR